MSDTFESDTLQEIGTNPGLEAWARTVEGRQWIAGYYGEEDVRPYSVEDRPFIPAKITVSNLIGCTGIAVAALTGPVMAISGKGPVRKVGIVLTALEAGVVMLGLKESKVLT